MDKTYINELKDFFKIKFAVTRGDYSIAVAEKIFKRVGRKTEIVALVNGMNINEVPDDVLDAYEEISTKRIYG